MDNSTIILRTKDENGYQSYTINIHKEASNNILGIILISLLVLSVIIFVVLLILIKKRKKK